MPQSTENQFTRKVFGAFMSAKNNLRSQVFANEYRIEKIRDKEFLVVPAVPVQEQVMNNYLVPAEELEFAEAWNGTSVCIRHPEQNNGSVNVPNPDVVVIGKFYNGVWEEDNNRMVGEYWIDVNEAMRYVEGQYVINAIYNNQVLETSTGYYAESDLTSGEFKGRKYDLIHRNLKPDHIAILVDKIGACSVADGCGVNRNSLLYSLYTNEVELNGGPGSGFWGHLGRPGQVGGASGTGTKPRGTPKPQKKLKKGVKAYYVAGKSEASKKNSSGFKTRVSLMSKSKAAALYNKMTGGGSEASILEVNLKAGTPYLSLTSSSITVQQVGSTDISIITFDTLQKRKNETFTNSADCNCTEAKKVMDNEESISQHIENLRKAFYEASNHDSPYSYYIADYFEDYLIVEGNGQLWKCTYTKSGDGYTFQSVDDWTKMMPNPDKYVEANATDSSRGGYLVVEEDGTKHLPTKKSGKYDRGLCGTAWAALHGGYRGQKYQGPNKSEAIAKLKRIYKAMKWDLPTEQNVHNETGTLPASGKKLWEKVYNAWLKKYPKDKAGASKRAWGAVKQAGWKKEGDTWVKSNSIVKGVDVVGARKQKRESVWTIVNSKFKQKEKPMKVKIADALAALRKSGVVINTGNDEVDEDELIEMELDDEDVEEPEVEEETTEKNTQQPATAVPQLNQTDIALVRKLSKVNWDAITKLAEQAPTLLEVTQNAQAERDARKKQLIAEIKMNSANPYTDDELNGFSLPVLTKMNSQYNVDYSGFGAGFTMSQNNESDTDEVLVPPSVVLSTQTEEA